MSMGKVVAFWSVTGAVATMGAELLLLAQASAPPSTSDVLGSGAAGGAIVGAIAWGAYKSKVDQHARELRALWETKADKESLRPITDTLRTIQEDVRWLVRRQHEKGE